MSHHCWARLTRMIALTGLLLVAKTGSVAAQSGWTQQEWTGAWGSDGPIFTGDLNADGKTDVFLWRDSTKTWTVNLSTGTGFSMQEWKGMWGSDGPIHVGDLNGDRRTDVFMWRDSTKTWTVNLSTGTGFSMQEWKGAWGSDGPIFVGDLNGDGKTDVFMWRDSTKTWTVNLSTGTGFSMQEWKGMWGSDGPIHVGDLNGDGKTDVFMWRDSTKTWTVNLSTGTGFSMQEWKGAWGSDGPIFVGDLNGDGKTDVFMWRDSTKTWTVNLSTGTGFSMQEWKGMWGSDGPIHVGDLNGDGKTDVFMWRDSEKVWSINVTQPPSPLRPLDLSYKATDLNGYPLNPVLLEQVNHPVTGKTLAKHIYDLECIKQLPDNGDLDDTHWNAWYTGDNSCTHYPVTKTTGNLLFGHVNFMPVAITGKIKWNDHSTDDGDYNLWIASTNNALGSIDQMLPDLTTALVYCEFDSDEAIDPLLDNVDEDDPFWWKQFKNAVDSGDPALLLTNRDGSGKEVIAIGLYSLDCCHPCEVELHPLYIMAIHVDSDPRADRWALLAFNKGNQGYCGGDRIGLDSNNGANAYYNGVDEQYSVLLPRPACSAGSAPVFTHKDVRVVLGGGKPIDAVAPKYFDSTFLRGKGEKLDFRLRYPGKQNDDDHYVIMGDITLDWGENEVPY